VLPHQNHQFLAPYARAQKTYGYSPEEVSRYRADLTTLATVIDDPPPTPGAVPRDPDDDKVIACVVAAGTRVPGQP
jgi:hypothetical protein